MSFKSVAIDIHISWMIKSENKPQLEKLEIGKKNFFKLIKNLLEVVRFFWTLVSSVCTVLKSRLSG